MNGRITIRKIHAVAESTQVTPAENVGEDGDEHPKKHEPEEERHQGPKRRSDGPLGQHLSASYRREASEQPTTDPVELPSASPATQGVTSSERGEQRRHMPPEARTCHPPRIRRPRGSLLPRPDPKSWARRVDGGASRTSWPRRSTGVTSGAYRVISRAVSAPPKCGMSQSISATSGWSRRARSRACSPLFVVATTSMSASRAACSIFRIAPASSLRAGYGVEVRHLRSVPGPVDRRFSLRNSLPPRLPHRQSPTIPGRPTFAEGCSGRLRAHHPIGTTQTVRGSRELSSLQEDATRFCISSDPT
jgi:hypothetical protein